MKKIILSAIALIASATFVNAQSTVHVNGYTTSTGTYVAPHYRTSANNTTVDNWSTKPNVNPYTGATGTKTPTATSTYYGTTTTPNYGSSSNSTNGSTNSSTSTYSTPIYRLPAIR